MVNEFFQLFKTPWEYYNNERSYDVVIVTKENNISKINARFLILFGSEQTSFDSENELHTQLKKTHVELEYDGERFSVYGSVVTFETKEGGVCIKAVDTGQAVGLIIQEGGKKTLRIGYDLFEEVYYLLSSGQQPGSESIPTLDIQISMLRSLILEAGIPLIEIPPIPAGFGFICCLTHDVDFAGIRNHKFDHTMFGFLYRAIFKTFIDVFNGKASLRKLIKNSAAVLSLPLVYLGILKDFWIQFERYMEIENGLPSTFFFMPFKKTPGRKNSESAPKRRESRYDISDVKSHVKNLISKGCEIGLHGIDAWIDPENGRKELDRIHQITGNPNIGIRMHWLYFNEKSPSHLEEAGFLYDATFGYNDAVGYRAGTTQTFKPLDSKNLLELPLHIQDTALFYSGRMDLSEIKAMALCSKLMENAKKYGGVLTVNWHHRSIAPERLWDEFYKQLLNHLQEYRVWFGKAGDVVRWFEKRRNVQFKEIKIQNRNLKVKICGHKGFQGPDLILRQHKPKLTFDENGKETNTGFIDVPIRDEDEIDVGL
jgi:hypothetical protein